MRPSVTSENRTTSPRPARTWFHLSSRVRTCGVAQREARKCGWQSAGHFPPLSMTTPASPAFLLSPTTFHLGSYTIKLITLQSLALARHLPPIQHSKRRAFPRLQSPRCHKAQGSSSHPLVVFGVPSSGLESRPIGRRNSWSATSTTSVSRGPRVFKGARSTPEWFD